MAWHVVFVTVTHEYKVVAWLQGWYAAKTSMSTCLKAHKAAERLLGVRQVDSMHVTDTSLHWYAALLCGVQIKSIWSVMLRNFDFEMIDPVPEADYDSMVIGPKPATVRFTRRKLQPAA